MRPIAQRLSLNNILLSDFKKDVAPLKIKRQKGNQIAREKCIVFKA